MPRIVKTTVYELNELSEAAKERARAWYRECCLDWDWHDYVYEDFQTVCGLLGVTLRTSSVRLMGGGTRETPRVYFRGFWNQGDGASYAKHVIMPSRPKQDPVLEAVSTDSAPQNPEQFPAKLRASA